MPMDNVIATYLVTAAVCLLIALLLWPGRKTAARVLRRWGVPQPGPGDVEHGLIYLRRRRLWYAPLFVGLPLLAERFDLLPDISDTAAVAATLMIGGLLAELFALRRPRQAQREALLSTRRVVDLVPWWALAVFGACAVVALVQLGLHRSWAHFAVTAAAAVVTGLIVVLAVRRPGAGSVETDHALRLRSARVGTGLGIAVTGTQIYPAADLASLVVFVVVLLAAWAMLSPAKPVALPTLR